MYSTNTTNDFLVGNKPTQLLYFHITIKKNIYHVTQKFNLTSENVYNLILLGNR